jgi:hypothetical protein
LIIISLFLSMGFIRLALPLTKSFFKFKVDVKNKEHITLLFNNQQFNAIKADEEFEKNEFKLGGFIYDIVNITKTNTGYLVRCYKDKAETTFLNNVKNALSKLLKSSTEKAELFDFDFIKIIQNQLHIQFDLNFKSIFISHFSRYIAVNQQLFLDSILLPPEMV